jgi:D-alanyl-D-alanine dipeptidase
MPDGSNATSLLESVAPGSRLRSYTLVSAALLCACTVSSQPLVQEAPEARFAGTNQLVVVTTAGWDSIAGSLQRFLRAHDGAPWRAEGSPVAVVVGRTGLAWGVGFDDAAANAGLDEPHKMEGDGRSPAGIYPLASTFGFAASLRGVRLPYLQLTPDVECVDDTGSKHYNAIVRRSESNPVDWTSSEKMSQVPVYRIGIVVDYNAAPVKGRGSCIFVHIAAGPRTPTVGCTALEAAELERLMTWLDPRARPLLVQLPAGVYARVQEGWGLPALNAAAS